MQSTLPCSCTKVVEDFDFQNFAERNKLYFGAISPIIAKISSDLLLEFKNLNGFYANEKKRFYEKINIGFTMEHNAELKVPVIHSTNTMSLSEITNEFVDLIKRNVANTLTLEDISKLTFTISDLSSVGDALSHTPIMAAYTSAILGVASDKSSSRLGLTLVYDHKMSSGREALLFLNKLVARLLEY